MSEVYDLYVDTAGNYHYTDTETGHHVIPNTAVGSFVYLCPRCRSENEEMQEVANKDAFYGEALND